jgi:hypothetical protein
MLQGNSAEMLRKLLNSKTIPGSLARKRGMTLLKWLIILRVE